MSEYYCNFMDKVGDAIIDLHDPHGKFRTNLDGWWLCDFRSVVTVVSAYVIFVLVGTRAMDTLPAVNTYPMKFAYNVSQIFLCAYMTVEAALLAFRNGYALLPHSSQDHKMDVATIGNLVWLFHVSKVWDFLDTIFIVLSKKSSQLSFLHIYHHAGIILVNWLIVNVLCGGINFLPIFLNGFIHTIMYLYYFVAMHTKDPKTGRSLRIWWKSSLTMFQLVQFILMMGQSSYLIMFRDGEKMPIGALKVYSLFILSMFLLFVQFYLNAYTKRKVFRGLPVFQYLQWIYGPFSGGSKKRPRRNSRVFHAAVR